MSKNAVFDCVVFVRRWGEESPYYPVKFTMSCDDKKIIAKRIQRHGYEVWKVDDVRPRHSSDENIPAPKV